MAFLPALKDGSFKDENEVRRFRIEGEGIMLPGSAKPFRFDNSVREDIPRKIGPNLPFVRKLEDKIPVIFPDTFSTEDISEIWVGPCCEFTEARDDVKKLLAKNGYDESKIEIKQVKLPYQYI